MKRILMSLAAIVVGLTGFALLSFAQEGDSLSTQDQIDSFVERRMEEWDIPGLSLVILRNTGPAYIKGYGFADLGERDPMEACTPVGIGSTMKGMTALAVTQLVAEGTVELDEPVSTYLPWFTTASPEGARITLRHALSMSAGLQSWLDRDDIDAGVSAGEWNVSHVEGALERRVRGLADAELLFAPGEGYSYANDGYALAGLVIEQVSGMPFETYMRERVFEPLGMERTGFGTADAAAQGYLRTADGLEPGGPIEVSGYRPAGIDIYSTACDLGRYLSGLMESTSDIVPEDATRTLWTAYSHVDERTRYGLGWYLEEREGVKVVRHGGHAMTSGSAIFMAPEQGIAVAVLANVDDIAVDSIGQALFEYVAGITDRLQRSASTFAPDRTVWERYVGDYTSPIGPLRIFTEGDTLTGTFTDPGLTFTLEAYSDTEFVTHSDVADLDGADAVFEIAADGSVRLHLAGKEIGVQQP